MWYVFGVGSLVRQLTCVRTVLAPQRLHHQSSNRLRFKNNNGLSLWGARSLTKRFALSRSRQIYIFFYCGNSESGNSFWYSFEMTIGSHSLRMKKLSSGIFCVCVRSYTISWNVFYVLSCEFFIYSDYNRLKLPFAFELILVLFYYAWVFRRLRTGLSCCFM